MENMRKIAIVVIIIIAATAGYVFVQRHCAAKEKSNVKVQLLNFGTDGDYDRHHRSSFDRGYEDGFRDGQRSCSLDR